MDFNRLDAHLTARLARQAAQAWTRAGRAEADGALGRQAIYELTAAAAITALRQLGHTATLRLGLLRVTTRRPTLTHQPDQLVEVRTSKR